MPDTSIPQLADVDELVADGDLLVMHNISKAANTRDQKLSITKLRADAFLGRINVWTASQVFDATMRWRASDSTVVSCARTILSVPNVSSGNTVRIDLTRNVSHRGYISDVRLVLSRTNSTSVWAECTGLVAWGCNNGSNGFVRANKLTASSSGSGSSLSVTAITNGVRISFAVGSLNNTAENNALMVETTGELAHNVSVSVTVV